jgi:ribosomal protein S11
MINHYKIKISYLDFNKMFTKIKLKKQYLQKLTNKIDLINNLKEKNYKRLNFFVFNVPSSQTVYEDFLVTYIIDITFSRSNSFLTVLDFAGNVKFFHSSGALGYPGKVKKKSKYVIIKNFSKVLHSKLTFLHDQPLVLNLKNADSFERLALNLLRKKLFIKVVSSFSLDPHNGCREKKVRRKKVRKKKVKKS